MILQSALIAQARPSATVDGLRLLSRMAETIEVRFRRATSRSRPGAQDAGEDADAIAKLLLTLELRLKLEEQVLLPALYDVLGQRVKPAERGLEREIGKLRELADQVRALEAVAARQQAMLLVLEGVSQLHLAAVERFAAHHAHRLNRARIGNDIQALMQRWESELRDTGDIEDEELDPVGLPPR